MSRSSSSLRASHRRSAGALPASARLWRAALQRSSVPGGAANAPSPPAPPAPAAASCKHIAILSKEFFVSEHLPAKPCMLLLENKLRKALNLFGSKW